jgi:hypothetical protein
MSTGSEGKWELASLRALARDAAQLTAAAAKAAGRTEVRPPGRRALGDAADSNAKAAKVMHLLLWGPK